MARNKVVEAGRKRLTMKYNVNRERSLDDNLTAHADALAARSRTPADLVAAWEEWAQMLAGRPDRHRRMLVGLRDGETQRTVARQVGVNARTVRRVLRSMSPDRWNATAGSASP